MSNQPTGGRKSPTRKIRPYKGGRFERINIRATQETKRQAEAEATRQKISVSDLFEQLIRSISNE